MDCTECQDNLSAYIEDELPPSERQKIADHMNTCPPCQVEHKSLARAHQLITENIMIEASPALWSRIEAQIQASALRPAPAVSMPERKPRFVWLYAWNPFSWRLAAGALATLTLTLGLAYFARQQREDHRIEQALQIYVQQRDQVEKTHMEQMQKRDVASTDEYDDNPFVVEDRHQMDNPFKL